MGLGGLRSPPSRGFVIWASWRLCHCDPDTLIPPCPRALKPGRVVLKRDRASESPRRLVKVQMLDAIFRVHVGLGWGLKICMLSK